MKELGIGVEIAIEGRRIVVNGVSVRVRDRVRDSY